MMLTTFRADLHLHTCLSPCGDEEMKPLSIVKHAKKRQLDVVAVCDHNSTRNVMAVCKAGLDEGLAVIGGIEISSEEEVHILGLFDEEQSLQDMQRLIDENLSGQNSPEFFGQQYLCDEHDVVVGREVKLLIGATKLTTDEVVAGIHRLGGLAVASHVDRESFSILGQLGFVPEGLEIDAVEISRRCSVAEARERFPQIKDYPVVCSSDAHRLEDIGAVSTTFTGASPSVKELRMALFGENGRQMAS